MGRHKAHQSPNQTSLTNYHSATLNYSAASLIWLPHTLQPPVPLLCQYILLPFSKLFSSSSRTFPILKALNLSYQTLSHIGLLPDCQYMTKAFGLHMHSDAQNLRNHVNHLSLQCSHNQYSDQENRILTPSLYFQSAQALTYQQPVSHEVAAATAHALCQAYCSTKAAP